MPAFRALNFLGLGLLALSFPLVARAQSTSAEMRAHEKQISDGLRDAINTGADLFNKANDRAGCYRVFQGALMAVYPLLSHKPALQKLITEGIVEAEKNSSPGGRAFALRDVMDKIRADLKSTGPIPAMITGTLWDRIGGESGVRKVVDDFVNLAVKDARVNFTRSNKFALTNENVTHLKKMMLEQISSLTGGPLRYTGKSMRDVHKGMGITEAEFDALAQDMKSALQTNGVKEADSDSILRAIAATKVDIVEASAGTKPAASTPSVMITLWDSMGGETTIRKVMDDFLQRAIADPAVDFSRGGKFKFTPQTQAELRDKLVDMVSQIGKGPREYKGKFMDDAHKGMKITAAQYDKCGTHLVDAMKKHGIKDADIAEMTKVLGDLKASIVDK